MKLVNGLSVGWLRDTSIGKLMQSDAPYLSECEFALVTSIDSTSNLRTITTVDTIIQRYPKSRYLGSGVVLPTARLPEVTNEFKLFTGFDEVWFFREDPHWEPPTGLSIVSPLNLEEDEVPPVVFDWMKISNCTLGLGDGIGLNFATSNEDIGKYLYGLGSIWIWQASPLLIWR